MSFGWSAGDIAAAIKLVYNVYEALDSSAGASRDYRDAAAFLKSLIHTLNPLKSLADWDAHPTYRDDIKRQVEVIRIPVTEFLLSIGKYESTLGRTAKGGRLRQFSPKMKWHVFCTKQTLALRSRIQSHMSVLNIVLHRLTIDIVIQTQKGLPELYRSVFQDTIKPELTATLTDALQHEFDGLLNTQKGEKQEFERSILRHLQNSKKSFESSGSSILHAHTVDVSAGPIARPPNAVDSQSYHGRAICFPNTTMMNSGNGRDCLEELYYLALVYLGHFLRDLFMLLSRMVRPSKQLVPDLVAKFHLTFFDAVGGGPRVLQYDAFRSFETLRAFIQSEFGTIQLVSRQQYLIHEENGRVLDETNWRDSVIPGSKISMSVVFRTFERGLKSYRLHICPRKLCQGARLIKSSPGWQECPRCEKNFFCSPFPLEAAKIKARLKTNPFSSGPTECPLQPHRLKTSQPSMRLRSANISEDLKRDGIIFEQVDKFEKESEEVMFHRIFPRFENLWSVMARISRTHPFEEFDIQRVKSKYPRLPAEISLRLGKANSLRRRVFRYWATQARSPPSSHACGDSAEVITQAIDLSGKTQSSEIGPFDMVVGLHGALAGAYINLFKLRSDCTRCVDCTICSRSMPQLLGLHRKFHLLQDVQPYICLHNSCQDPPKFFHQRRDWIKHNLEAHRGNIFPGISFNDGEQCPMCLQRTESAGYHVARHMEHLAAYSVPSDDD